jgi:hypothetical protein
VLKKDIWDVEGVGSMFILDRNPHRHRESYGRICFAELPRQLSFCRSPLFSGYPPLTKQILHTRWQQLARSFCYATPNLSCPILDTLTEREIFPSPQRSVYVRCRAEIIGSSSRKWRVRLVLQIARTTLESEKSSSCASLSNIK